MPDPAMRLDSGEQSGSVNGSSVAAPTSDRRLQLLHQPGSGSHIVQFYEEDEFLAATVAQFVGFGFLAGEPVIVIATEAHRQAFVRALQAASFDVERARATGQLTLLDAAETLATFMADGVPDWELFQRHVGSVIRRVVTPKGRAYGEMVDLLFQQGNPTAALELEEMWNRLAQLHSFCLLCAYGMKHFSKEQHARELERVCGTHTHALPTERFSELTTEGERWQRTVLLEQRARSLENEIERRMALEHQLREALAATKLGHEELRCSVEKLDAQNRINETLARIAGALSSELDPDALIQKLTDEATAICAAQFGAFFYNLVDDAGESYTLYTLSGAPREAFAKFPMPRNTAIFEPTFSGRHVVRLADVKQDPRYGKSGPYHGMPEGHLPVRSYLAVPVKSRSGEVLGGLFFGHAQPDVFTDVHERLLVAVAAQAAVAIDNAKLFGATLEAEETAQREREKLEAIANELESANRTKDEFLATVSHELRTPLNAILGWVRMLRSGNLPEEKRERALEIIERNANAQTQLIEDLLDVSRIISGKLRLDMRGVELSMVAENAIEAVRPAAHAKNVTLEQVIDRELTPICGDPARLQQVVWNLLTNAVRFTPAGGQVTLTVRQRPSSVELSVADTGQGIDAAFLPKIFERFRQADPTTTRKHGGLGLGLAIVRHLVELHGGTVQVFSEGQGRGATFSVLLPIAPASSSSLQRPPALRFGAPRAELQCAQELEGVTVLVVDDEQDAREMLREMLGACKATVATASSVAEALSLLPELRPDVVVSDIGMPDEDGYVLIRKLRALPDNCGGRTPAIALTAYSRFEDRTKALVAGFNMHVPKPVEPGELLASLGSLTAMFPSKRG